MSDDVHPMFPSEAWKQRLALAYEQTGDAEERLHKQAKDVLRWPWHDLDALTGPLGLGGEVWFLVAVSGSGKTTFVTSLIEEMRLAGKKIYAMPLETQAAAFRTTLACLTLADHPDPAMRCVIDPGDVNSGHWLSLPNVDELRRKLAAVYTAQREEPFLDQVVISKARAIDVRRFRAAFEQAVAHGADLMIVDHIDHIDGGTGHVAQASKEVCHAALEMAQETGMTVLFTSQINFDMLRTPDKLAKYQPPQIQHLKYPTHKVEVATGIIGLSRVIRPPAEGEDAKDYAAALKAARADEKLATEMLVPGVTQVNAMKLRYYGSRTGQRTLLGYDHGRIVSVAERDRYRTGLGGRMLRAV